MKRALLLLLPPILVSPLRRLYWRIRHGKPFPASTSGFEGWGMRSSHYPPWTDALPGSLEARFLDAHARLKSALAAGEIILTQFGAASAAAVDSLLWRHYIVFWSASYAVINTKGPDKHLTECGVCDGLTIFFALSATAEPSKAFLYDSWAPMKSDHLLPSERSVAGKYADLEIGNTRRNLAGFGSRAVFNAGYIPDSFSRSNNPETLVWLHIDLNSSKPTIAALDFFFARLQPGGIILFDDYAWEGFEDTRRAVRSWCEDKDGRLLPLPTGQALFFKA